MSPTAPILTDALIDRVMREQRQHLRPPSGWGYSAWPLRAEQALETLTEEGLCQVGWIERANHRRVTNPVRDQVRWHVDTGEVRLERQTAESSPVEDARGHTCQSATTSLHSYPGPGCGQVCPQIQGGSTKTQ